jgi:arabinogalactan endo-1,4-beta-galactosidase
MRYNRPYEDEPEVIVQFHPGEWQARFEAEWDDETANWKFGKRVDKQAVNAAENCALNSLIVAAGVYCYADPATRLLTQSPRLSWPS